MPVNLFDLNPLREALAEEIDFERLRAIAGEAAYRGDAGERWRVAHIPRDRIEQ
jgi:hypothetical protein